MDRGLPVSTLWNPAAHELPRSTWTWPALNGWNYHRIPSRKHQRRPEITRRQPSRNMLRFRQMLRINALVNPWPKPSCVILTSCY